MARFCFVLGEIQVKFAAKKYACEIRCNASQHHGISCKFNGIDVLVVGEANVPGSLIHQHDSLVEVGGLAVYAIDFLQQAAAGE